MLQLPGVAVVDVLISAFWICLLIPQGKSFAHHKGGLIYLIDDERGSEMVVVQF